MKVLRHPPLHSKSFLALSGPTSLPVVPSPKVKSSWKSSVEFREIESLLCHIYHPPGHEAWPPTVLGPRPHVLVEPAEDLLFRCRGSVQIFLHFLQKSKSLIFLFSFVAQLFEELVDVVPLFIFLLLVVGRYLGSLNVSPSLLRSLYRFHSMCEIYIKVTRPIHVLLERLLSLLWFWDAPPVCGFDFDLHYLFLSIRHASLLVQIPVLIRQPIQDF